MESKTYTASNPAPAETSPASTPQAAFLRLSAILDRLRIECPWDREQTMKSLRYLTIEEVHELSEAIIALESAAAAPAASSAPSEELQGNDLKKELGDLAMHILFYCKLAEDERLFSTTDVYNAICDKLVDRHPFIYRQRDYHGESWEQLKMREGRKGPLDGVPDSLPALAKAVRMQEKIAGMQKGSPAAPLAEALAEADCAPQHAMPLPPEGTTEAEFGRMLFALIDWARSHGINADDALSLANRQFRQHFSSR